MNQPLIINNRQAVVFDEHGKEHVLEYSINVTRGQQELNFTVPDGWSIVRDLAGNVMLIETGRTDRPDFIDLPHPPMM